MNDNVKRINHLGIIMDGNRRWAIKKMLPMLEGYKAGAKVAKTAVELAINFSIPNLTLYALSADNLQRPKEQIFFLFGALEKHLLEKQKIIIEKKIRLKVIGERSSLPESLKAAISTVEEESKDNTKLNLYLAINYGGRNEILDACKKILIEKGSPDDINIENFAKYLYAPQMPDLDYVIRTGGSERISDFLLWKISYAELFFLKTLWPDVTKKQLISAIETFQTRSRTFGKDLACKI